MRVEAIFFSLILFFYGSHNLSKKNITLLKYKKFDIIIIFKFKRFYILKYILYLTTIFYFIACSTKTTISKKKSKEIASYVSKEYLQKLDFKGKELIAVPFGKDFYYINRDGKKILTLTYDNGADEFNDGLARTRVDGKIGFFNRNLEIVLPPVYDFAFPFHKGIAEICVGCIEKGEGEYSMLDGGEWKKIDRDGLIIE